MKPDPFQMHCLLQIHLIVLHYNTATTQLWGAQNKQTAVVLINNMTTNVNEWWAALSYKLHIIQNTTGHTIKFHSKHQLKIWCGIHFLYTHINTEPNSDCLTFLSLSPKTLLKSNFYSSILLWVILGLGLATVDSFVSFLLARLSAALWYCGKSEYARPRYLWCVNMG